MSRTTRSVLIREALAAYVDIQEWHVSEIRKALVEAERKEFATDEQVARTIRK